MNDSNGYDDIINLPHHTSDKYPRMARIDRAAQFAPFAALTGYGDAVRETARFTERETELSENELEELDLKMGYIRAHAEEKPVAKITYFKPDARKSGGAYLTAVGTVDKIDDFGRTVVMSCGAVIPFESVRGIEIEG